ncbi:hypothetical protein [Streptomyces sp. NPDC001315]|uniref:hypothetical protein n=1 Tax=Streptomyces sp. NPDC001315 TaxID=3364562 RepID=UPI0036C53DB9
MPSRIRISSRGALAAAGLTAVLGTAVAPATAAPATDDVALHLTAPATMVVYNADEGGKAVKSDFVVPVEVTGDGTPARNIKVVVDASGLEGIARVTKGGYGNCTGQGWVYTCMYGTMKDDSEANAPFDILGVDGVQPGDSGTVTYTAGADNVAPVTGTTRMIIGGPTLNAPAKEEAVSGVEPGKPEPVTPRFANLTRFTAKRGVALQVKVSDELTLTKRHSNCYYAGSSPTSAWCTFPTKAAPGTAYRTSSPLTFTAAPGKLTGRVSYSWSSAPQKPGDHTVRGTGAPLTLTGTADRGFGGGEGVLKVETTEQADYEPVTATVRGRVGDTVKVRLGVRDLSPGRLMSDETLGRFEVVPPEGTTVTSIPYTFEDSGGDWACKRPDKSGGAFVCEIGDALFSEGEDGTTTIDFHVRIDRQVPGARGTIRTYNPFDRTPGNDTAVIPVQASPALPHRPFLRPATWAAIGAGAVGVVVLVTAYRRRRGRPGEAG